MTHARIDQLRVTRSEWLRGLADLPDYVGEIETQAPFRPQDGSEEF